MTAQFSSIQAYPIDPLFVLRVMTTRGAGSRLLTRMLADNLSSSDEITPLRLQERYGLAPEVSEALGKEDESARDTWNEISRRGIRMLLRSSSEYPQRLVRILGAKAPPVLFALGNLDILSQNAVGFCGSRKASEKGLEVAATCANLLAKENINIVSGYAHGVDLAVHKAALEQGATTIVLPEGFLGFSIKRMIKELAKTDNILVVSEFSPRMPWTVGNAMTRNRTICGLSKALIVIESGTEGGTFEAGKVALELGIPLFAVDYAEPAPSAGGNAYFLAHGASRLRRHKTGEPNLTEVLNAVAKEVDTRQTTLPLG